MLRPQKILLCGGPDRCGKTSILRELEQRTKIPYFKANNEHQNFLNDQERFINEIRFSDVKMVDFLYQTGVSVLMDRGYMCEFVYAQFFNRPTDTKVLRSLDRAYARMGAKVLICSRRSFKGICDDLRSDLDEIALERIARLYDDFIRWSKCNCYTLYVDDEDLGRELQEILAFLKE